jgi:DNA-binding transcriptional LysR family regulator
MTCRPPPLQWLPPFEAAARLLSFSQAAQELHVTTSAVGQQIKNLEAHLGFRLFVRHTRRVELTEAGHAYAELASRLLRNFRAGHERTLQGLSKPVLRISMTPLVAHDLVLPALAEFQALYPDITLQIDATMGLADFGAQTLDAAIRYGEGPWSGVTALPLSHCSAAIVASPKLMIHHPIRSPKDLALTTLIHQSADQAEWQQMAQFMGVTDIPHRSDLILDSNLAALRAAEQGLGVALAVWPLLKPWLDSGRLVALTPPVELASGDHFLYAPDSPKQPQLLAVYAWIRSLFERLEEPADPETSSRRPGRATGRQRR